MAELTEVAEEKKEADQEKKETVQEKLVRLEQAYRQTVVATQKVKDQLSLAHETEKAALLLFTNVHVTVLNNIISNQNARLKESSSPPVVPPTPTPLPTPSPPVVPPLPTPTPTPSPPVVPPLPTPPHVDNVVAQ